MKSRIVFTRLLFLDGSPGARQEDGGHFVVLLLLAVGYPLVGDDDEGSFYDRLGSFARVALLDRRLRLGFRDRGNRGGAVGDETGSHRLPVLVAAARDYIGL